MDELYRHWSATKAKVISAPQSKPWGLHEFTAADLDGNLFRVFYDFATPARDLSLTTLFACLFPVQHDALHHVE